ncbi:hypothetical protein Tco_0170027 [Tanacetum coccineum]
MVRASTSNPYFILSNLRNLGQPYNNNEFALAAEAAPDNMNSWVEEEDPEIEEEEEDPDEDPEMEEEERRDGCNETMGRP